MFGLVNTALLELLLSKLGEEKTAEILAEAKAPSQFSTLCVFDDSITYNIAFAASRISGLGVDVLLEMLGEFWIEYTAERYSAWYQLVGSTFPGVLCGLNQLHAHVKSVMPGTYPPSIWGTEVTENSMVLHYKPGVKSRVALGFMMIGLVKGLAKLYGCEATCVLTVERDDEKSQHEQFLVEWKTNETQPEAPFSATPSLQTACLLGLPPQAVDKILPFHIVCTTTLEVVQIGSLSRLVLPHLQVKHSLGTVFRLRSGEEVTPEVATDNASIQLVSRDDCTIPAAAEMSGCPFASTVLAAAPKQEELVWHGKVLVMSNSELDENCLWFLIEPELTPELLALHGIRLQDISSGQAHHTLLAASKDQAVLESQLLAQHIESMELAQRKEKLARQELEKMHEELQRQKDAVESARDQQRKFLSYVCHEVRNPLSTLSAGLEILDLDQQIQEESYTIITMMRQSLLAASKILDDTLSLKRMEEGRLVLEPELIRLSQLCRRVVLGQTTVADKSRISLTVRNNVQSDQDAVIADPYRIEQVCQNLVSNALKFTPPGGSVTVTLDADTAREVIFMSVSDTGCGIPKSEIGNLFQEYVQISAGKNQRGGGTGLGLAISRRIAELHDGWISVQSTLGEGSVFTLALPCVSGTRFTRITGLPSPSQLDSGENSSAAASPGSTPSSFIASQKCAHAWEWVGSTMRIATPSLPSPSHRRRGTLTDSPSHMRRDSSSSRQGLPPLSSPSHGSARGSIQSGSSGEGPPRAASPTGRGPLSPSDFARFCMDPGAVAGVKMALAPPTPVVLQAVPSTFPPRGPVASKGASSPGPVAPGGIEAGTAESSATEKLNDRRAVLAAASPASAPGDRRAALDLSASALAPANPGAASCPVTPVQPLPMGGWKVLLVDDDKMVRRMTSVLLCKWGATVTEGFNGGDFLQLLGCDPECTGEDECECSGCSRDAAEAAEDRQEYDLAVLDNQMPGMYGGPALVRFRRQEKLAQWPRLPVVMLTGDMSEDVMGVLKGNGADHVLGKPLRRQQLAHALEQVGLRVAAPL